VGQKRVESLQRECARRGAADVVERLATTLAPVQ
jgi:hypothetical protein